MGHQLRIKGLIRISERGLSLLAGLEAGLGSGVFLALRGHMKSLLPGNPRLLGFKAFGHFAVRKLTAYTSQEQEELEITFACQEKKKKQVKESKQQLKNT